MLDARRQRRDVIEDLKAAAPAVTARIESAWRYSL
jgi:hypothetical protein